jgi:hypothetical protein
MDDSHQKEMLEKLAELEHLQWQSWSKSICSHLLLDRSPMRMRDRVLTKHDSWELLWVPYDMLSEDMKEQDRIFARKVIEILKSFGVFDEPKIQG